MRKLIRAKATPSVPGTPKNVESTKFPVFKENMNSLQDSSQTTVKSKLETLKTFLAENISDFREHEGMNDDMGCSAFGGTVDFSEDTIEQFHPGVRVKIEPVGTNEKNKSKIFRIKRSAAQLFQIHVKIGDLYHETFRTVHEFKVLRRNLSARFSGMVVPPLPISLPTAPFYKTKSISKSSSKFEKQKMMMRLFLEALLANPFLKADSVVTHFLQSSESFDKKFSDFVASTFESAGLQRWREMINLCILPNNPFDKLTQTQTELNDLGATYTNLSSILSAFAKKTVAFSQANDEIGEFFSTWSEAEKQHKFTNCEAQLSLSSVAQGFKSVSSKNVDQAKMFHNLVRSEIRFETELLDCMKKELQKVKLALNKFHKASRILETTEAAAIKQNMQFPTATSNVQDIPSSPQLTGKLDSTMRSCVSSNEYENENLNLTNLTHIPPSNAKSVVNARLAKRSAEAQARKAICSVLVVEMQRFRVHRGRKISQILKIISSNLQQQHASLYTELQTIDSSLREKDFATAAEISSDLQLVETFGLINDQRQSEEHIPAEINFSDELEDGFEEAKRAQYEDSCGDYQSDEDLVEDNEQVDQNVEATEESNEEKQQSQAEETLYQVVHPFLGENENEMTVLKGEILIFDSEENDVDGEWLWCTKQNDRSNEGYVPKTHIKPISGVV